MKEKTYNLISILTSIAALIISVIALFHQVIIPSDDHITKAKAGYVESQIFLANHYYEVGNISDSVYWYDVASQHEGSHQAKSINNLAYLYLTEERFSTSKENVYCDAMKMFSASARMGEIDAAKNLYILLISNPRELFNENYNSELEWVTSVLSEHEGVLQELSRFETEWKYNETVTGEDVPANNNTYLYFEIGSADYVYSNGTFKWIHTYQVYERISEADSPEYYYCRMD